MAVSDDELMRRYVEGDEAAFHMLFDRYRALVYNFARYMLNDPFRAEDILQDTFLSVARSAPRYRPEGRFRTWLLRIVRNRCLNLLEADRARRAATIRERPEFPAIETSPGRRIEAAERMAAVREALSRLPERQREALVLYGFDSMSYDEIAGVLDVPINTVKTIIHRGRAALARAIQDKEPDAP
ncbi:MAG: RNA polymerase sigma factor [Candidatus Hydrogenedentes bacterium]|nr:RNA polymerase sigma factor [Candidatus Hydrogenedentota bacterium]